MAEKNGDTFWSKEGSLKQTAVSAFCPNADLLPSQCKKSCRDVFPDKGALYVASCCPKYVTEADGVTTLQWAWACLQEALVSLNPLSSSSKVQLVTAQFKCLLDWVGAHFGFSTQKKYLNWI